MSAEDGAAEVHKGFYIYEVVFFRTRRFAPLDDYPRHSLIVFVMNERDIIIKME